MKLVYTHENITLVSNVSALLENAGIKTQIKNQYSMGGRGEIPVFETWPEVWVTEARHVEKAEHLIDQLLNKQSDPDWVCPSCGEQNGAMFDFCWQCEVEKPN